MTKQDLPQYVTNALIALGGSGSIVQVCKHIWENEVSLIPPNQRNDLFYTWQYDVRWAAQTLRNNNLSHILSTGIWAIGPKP